MRAMLTLFVCLLLSLPAAAAPLSLVLNTPLAAPLSTPAHDGALDLIYAELARRTGIAIVLQAMPAERGLQNANRGLDDGEVARVPGMEREYPNLVQVPEPVLRYQLVAFSRQALQLDGSASLRPYDVGIPHGWKILERLINQHQSRVSLASGQQLLAMLNKERLDVVVLERLQGLQLIRSMCLQGIRALRPPLFEGDGFLYLHRKHADLVPPLAAALRAMKQDGSYQRIVDSVLQRYPG
ncbi:MAG: substrate-binding periplasmic protein [Sphingomonadaceae bacterium]